MKRILIGCIALFLVAGCQGGSGQPQAGESNGNNGLPQVGTNINQQSGSQEEHVVTLKSGEQLRIGGETEVWQPLVTHGRVVHGTIVNMYAETGSVWIAEPQPQGIDVYNYRYVVDLLVTKQRVQSDDDNVSEFEAVANPFTIRGVVTLFSNDDEHILYIRELSEPSADVMSYQRYTIVEMSEYLPHRYYAEAEMTDAMYRFYNER